MENNGVFVAYGGGKDSSYTVAFVRLMQLIFYKDYGSTFKLCVATNRHAGMPQAVMENINRAYHALHFYEDPKVEILLIDGNDVTIFDKRTPLPSMVAYNLSEQHLICMIFSPFVECGKNMEIYFEAMHPELFPRMSEIQALLIESQGIDANTKEFLVSFLFEISGLPLAQIKALYRKRSITNMPNSDYNDSPIAIISESDPHKAIIETRYKPDGPIVKELITGR